MGSSLSSRLFLLLMVLVLIPGAALAITSEAGKPPCPCNLSGHIVSWSCIWEGVDPVFPYKLPNVEVEYRDCMGGSGKAVRGARSASR